MSGQSVSSSSGILRFVLKHIAAGEPEVFSFCWRLWRCIPTRSAARVTLPPVSVEHRSMIGALEFAARLAEIRQIRDAEYPPPRLGSTGPGRNAFRGGTLDCAWRGSLRADRRPEFRPSASDGAAFDGVSQFADISRPVDSRPVATSPRRLISCISTVRLSRKVCRKFSASIGISSRRSRRGGRSICTTRNR